MAGSFFTGIPNSLVGDGSVLIVRRHAAGEKVGPGLLPPPILTQRLQQRRAERQIPAVAALAALHPNHHAAAVDIAHLEQRYLCPSHTRAVKRHQQSTLREVTSCIDKPGYF